VAKVGLCEDDEALRSTLIRSVKAAGHEVVIARSGAEALRTFPPLAPDVVILDIGLPDSDGRDVCLALRAGGLKSPVLFLTARDAIHDKVAGFESGGDDYLTKPFELAELLVRIQALARRSMSASTPGKGLELDPPSTRSRSRTQPSP
jgi:two-component system response regulator MprA